MYDSKIIIILYTPTTHVHQDQNLIIAKKLLTNGKKKQPKNYKPQNIGVRIIILY